MKNYLFLSTLLFVIMAVSCHSKDKNEKADVVNLIFETDMGNDVDDALALDMIYKYIDKGEVNLLGIMLNKEGIAPAEYIDIMGTWYGYHDVPLGVVREGADCENDALNYAQAVVNMKNDEGEDLFCRSKIDYEKLPEAYCLYRKILSQQPDNSVTVVSVGFSTNLAKLLETGPDEYSPLTGKELVAKKVKLLCTMAGHIGDVNFHEYNVVKDIHSAKVVFENWPGKIVTSPFEVGIQICYPAKSIEEDFKWAPLHPMVEAYKAYMQMPYDRPTWDLTSVLYAVEGDSWFTMSQPGRIIITDKGGMNFVPDKRGNRYYFSVDKHQSEKIKDRFISLLTAKPKSFK